MWVRTQNREEMLNCNDFRVFQKKTLEYWFVVANLREDSEYTGYDFLGKYKSKERAIEVLDDIQECLMGYPTKNLNVGHDCPMLGTEYHCVYEMPKE